MQYLLQLFSLRTQRFQTLAYPLVALPKGLPLGLQQSLLAAKSLDLFGQLLGIVQRQRGDLLLLGEQHAQGAAHGMVMMVSGMISGQRRSAGLEAQLVLGNTVDAEARNLLPDLSHLAQLRLLQPLQTLQHQQLVQVAAPPDLVLLAL